MRDDEHAPEGASKVELSASTQAWLEFANIDKEDLHALELARGHLPKFEHVVERVRDCRSIRAIRNAVRTANWANAFLLSRGVTEDEIETAVDAYDALARARGAAH